MRKAVDHVAAHSRGTGRTLAWALASALVIHSAAGAGTIAQTPLFLTAPVDPMVMLVMSKDHQLFYKAYNDYSDLDDDGTIETTYKPTFNYYGYFDSNACYSYNSGKFVPAGDTDSQHYCDGTSSHWSGNFLNWITMSRMDIVRKLLYGGQRQAGNDTPTLTVLERAYIPTDAHSWAKYYNGPYIRKLTPFNPPTSGGVAKDRGISFCNTTHANPRTGSTSKSQNVTTSPLMMVAQGNFSLWAANERWQCHWKGDQPSVNGNTIVSGISAYSENPVKGTHGLGDKEYVVRVQACGASLYGAEQETCFTYPGGNRKPVGLLQEYADRIQFGLITGSYNKNVSGGVLRKNIADFTDEIDSEDGTFTTNPRIVSTLNKLRMYGYYYNDGTYLGTNGDNCNFQLTGIVATGSTPPTGSVTEGSCTSWGNPISEMFLETLRYYAGESGPTSAFQTDSDRLGLSAATWQDPLSEDNECAVLNTVVFNASVSSYDGDGLNDFSSITAGSSLGSLVDNIGDKEGISGQEVFIGESDGGNDLLCTGKTINNLSSAEGVCPEAPTLEGTYDIAGLAHYAHTNDLRDDLDGNQTMKTYGVALSPAVPRIEVPVGQKAVTILPAYILNHSSNGRGAGTLVDFKVVSRSATSGKFYVNWEDSEQGGDYDQDVWGLIEYQVSGNQITVTTDAIAESTNQRQGFGYIISGTTQDGFHAHSGIEGFNYTDPTGVPGCSNCQVGDAATSHIYTGGAASAKLIEQPLYYAAQWGGFEEDEDNPGTVDEPDQISEWDADGDGQPDNYFFVTNPAKLATSLQEVFTKVEEEQASASAVAANSTSLQTGTLIFQARFDSTNWTGDLVALPLNADGSIGTPAWMAAGELDSKDQDSREIITLNPATEEGIAFRWGQLDTGAGSQQAMLNGADDNGEARLNFLRGDRAGELQQGGNFRDRDSVLGDIINSAPAFMSSVPPFNYPGSLEAESYVDFKNDVKAANRPPMVYAGANDGMLHGFDAETGEERLAYAPNRIFAGIGNLADQDYRETHRYYVDGSPTVGDAFFGGAWKSVLVGSLGAGGQGLFALNVTDPDNFTEGNAENIVMWEFTDADDADLGYTIGQASIVKMQNGKWAAIVGNGYNNTATSDSNNVPDTNVSATGQAALFIIPLDNPSNYVKISTNVGTTFDPNGLATPAAVDFDGDNLVDYVYAGDLRGNLWKFDVSDSSSGNWDVAFGDASNPEPLFKAVDASGKAQPITVQPEVGRHLSGQPGFMVYFGTGRFFEDGDNDPDDFETFSQTFYGIWDANNDTNDASRGNLQQQEVVYEGQVPAGFDDQFRIVSDEPVDWSSQKGWYLDLPTSGERVVADSIVSNGRVIFVTAIPSQTPCDFGGDGWLMELDANNGGLIEEFTFDVNDDGVIDEEDLVNMTDLNGDDKTVAPSGRKSSSGLIQKPTIISQPASDIEYKYSSGSKDAGIEAVRESKGDGIRGRVSWEQLR